MVQIVLVDKAGVVKDTNINSYDEAKLYRKAGFKSNGGFSQRVSWEYVHNSTVYLYGKNDGRAGQENKYDLPPPADNILLFGTSVIICKDENDNITNFNSKMWNSFYERLFGGFEDINKEDSDEDEDEDEVYADLPKTNVGYAKDGFVVDDEDEDDEGEDEDEEDDCDDEEDNITHKTRSASKKQYDVFSNLTSSVSEKYCACGDELSEEEYI